ncbi:hypothetical protein [Geodermatophilus sp. SYSU D00710]
MRIDRTVETKLGPDKWEALMGLSVGFCCFSPDGRVLIRQTYGPP